MDELTANHIYANPLCFRHQRNLSIAKPNTVLVPSFPLYSPNITIITGNGSCLYQILKDCLIAFRLGIRGKTSRGVSRLPTLSRLVFVSPLSNYKAFSHRENLTTYQVNLWHIMSKLATPEDNVIATKAGTFQTDTSGIIFPMRDFLGFD